MLTYSIGGVTGPAGGPDVASAAVIADGAVSATTAADEAWWKLTATAGGEFEFDASLSMVDDAGTPASQVRIELYQSDVGPNPTSTGDLTFLDASNFSFEDFYPLVSGTTYLIRLTPLSPSTGVGLVLRTSTYAGDTGWIQPPDQVINLAPPNADTLTGYTPTSFYADGFTHDPLAAGTGGAIFHGTYQLNHSFANTNWPSESQAGRDCGYLHARVGKWGFRYWSSDGGSASLGMGCVYDSAFADAGGSVTDWPLGVKFTKQTHAGTTGGGDAPTVWDVWALTQRANLTNVVGTFDQYAGADPSTNPDWAPPSGYTGFPTSESSESTLVELEVMPTETDSATHAPQDDGDPVWYFKALADTDASRTDETWGPKDPTSTTSHSNWLGATAALGDGPDAYIAAQDQALTWGAWNTVDHAAVLAAEAAATDINYTGGVQLTGLSHDQVNFAASAPGWSTDVNHNDPATTQSSLRSQQVCVMRLTLRPGRIKFFRAPQILEVEAAAVGIPPLRLTNRNDLYSSAPSLVNAGFYQQGGNRLTGPI